MKKHRRLLNNQYEVCVLCRAQLEIPVCRPIGCREFYVCGVGQLCQRCYAEIECSLTQADIERREKEMRTLLHMSHKSK